MNQKTQTEKNFQVVCDDRGYVTGYATVGGFPNGIELEGEPPVDFAEKCRGYRLVDGQLIFDHDKMEEVEQEAADREHAATVSQKLDIMRTQQIDVALRMTIQCMDLPDDKAMEVALIYPEYEVNHQYVVGDVFRYGLNADEEPQLYKVVQAHTSQADWKPDGLPALYKAIGFTDDGVNIWTQPSGAHDAYRKGDIVDYNGKIWVCIVSVSTYPPGMALPIPEWEIKK